MGAVFEQPLNERYRLFLRVDQLFARLEHHLAGDTIWETHACLQTLIELLQTFARGDSKRELIKELERQRSAIARFHEREAVDPVALQDVLDEQQAVLDALHGLPGALGHELRGNDLLNQLQQRATAGGRPGIVELPGYQAWLQRDVAERHATIRHWLTPLHPAHAAVEQCLQVVREAIDWRTVDAPGGYYEQALEPDQAPQMLRLRLPDSTQCFPEVSAGRQRFSVRFFEQEDPADRARQVRSHVRFELSCCGV